MKAKSFYKNNKHNNMDSKEKENINEEELKAQDAQDETCEETTEKRRRSCPDRGRKTHPGTGKGQR